MIILFVVVVHLGQLFDESYYMNVSRDMLYLAKEVQEFFND